MDRKLPKPRDQVNQAFAGKENNGPGGQKNDHRHSTNVKSRSTKYSRYRIPKR